MRALLLAGAAAGGDDDAVRAFEPLLLYASASASGALRLKVAHRGAKPPVNKLRTERVCFLDTGFQCFIWAGKGAPRQDRACGPGAASTRRANPTACVACAVCTALRLGLHGGCARQVVLPLLPAVPRAVQTAVGAADHALQRGHGGG